MIEIRPVALDDADRVQRLAEHPDVVEMTRMPSPYPADGARTFLAKALAERAAGKGYVFAMIVDGALVGLCALRDVGGEPGAAELGYWVGKAYWGRGYASACAERVVAWGFESLRLERIWAQCVERNRASVRVLAKLGFEAVARRPNTYAKWRDDDVVARWELDRARWSRRGGGSVRVENACAGE